MSPTRRSIRALTLAVCVLFLPAALAGCGSDASMTGADESLETPNQMGDVKSDTSTSYSSDVVASDSSGWSPMDASSSDATGGTPYPGTNGDMGIGLKPGGAQDINYFRMLLGQGKLPKAADMTIEGWLNEHDTLLPKANPERSIDLHAMAAILQGTANVAPEVVLQLGFNSGMSLEQVKAKVALTLVIDRSGSMWGDKLEYVKAGMRALIEVLPVGTRLAIVSFSSDVKTDWPAKDFTADDKPALLNVINQLTSDGGTNIYDALWAGIFVCKSAGPEYTFRRVLLLSDGQATEGNTDPNAILAVAKGGKQSGCSISTAGVGYDFDLPLMTKIAQQADGTAWFLPNAEKAKEVFIEDLQTMLLPVGQNLWVQFKLAEGWHVEQIYGFEWVEKDGVVKLLGPKKDEPSDPEQGTDQGDTVETPDTTDESPPVALPTLFASKKNGLVMARLIPPEGSDLAKIQDLLLADITYGYTLSKTNESQQFTVPVTVPGVVQIPDGGIGYFASPIVRRAFTLLQVGRALMRSCTRFEAGQVVEALAVLDEAKTLVAQQKAEFSAEELAKVDMAPGLDDAAELAALLKSVMAQGQAQQTP